MNKVRIPIIDRHRHIVGWADEPPSRGEDGRLHHPLAESLIGTPIASLMVTLAGEDAERAGAPPLLRDGWHCFAIVSGEGEGAPFR